MDTIDSKNIAREEDVRDDTDFRKFLDAEKEGISIVHESYREIEGVVAQPSTGDFVKWVRINSPETKINDASSDKTLVLHSSEYWLPLVFLASDITLPVYLNIVANYLYDKSKGLLMGETNRVRLSVVYEDKISKKIKKFQFEGDSKTLGKTIKKIDLNRFMD